MSPIQTVLVFPCGQTHIPLDFPLRFVRLSVKRVVAVKSSSNQLLGAGGFKKVLALVRLKFVERFVVIKCFNDPCRQKYYCVYGLLIAIGVAIMSGL